MANVNSTKEQVSFTAFVHHLRMTHRGFKGFIAKNLTFSAQMANKRVGDVITMGSAIRTSWDVTVLQNLMILNFVKRTLVRAVQKKEISYSAPSVPVHVLV